MMHFTKAQTLIHKQAFHTRLSRIFHPPLSIHLLWHLIAYNVLMCR